MFTPFTNLISRNPELKYLLSFNFGNTKELNMDGFDFEDSLGSLGASDEEPAYVPPPKKEPTKPIFSDDSDHGKPKTQVDKSIVF